MRQTPELVLPSLGMDPVFLFPEVCDAPAALANPSGWGNVRFSNVAGVVAGLLFFFL